MSIPEGQVPLCDRPTDDLSTFLTGHPSPPETPILHWMSGSATLDEVNSAAWTLAELLGPLRGAPVVCVVDHGFDAVVAMFGTWLAGGVYVPLNGRLPDPELRRQLTDTNPAVVLSGSTQAGRVPAEFSQIVALGRDEFQSKPGADWQGRTLPDGAALVMRTSGTTGSAKPIPLRHTGVRDGIDTVIARLRGDGAGARRPMPNLVPTSLALWAGIWNTLFAFRLGAPVVLMDRFDPLDYAKLVNRFHIRSTVLAPAMMTMLASEPQVRDLTPLRLVRSITAPLLPDQVRRFHDRFGVDVLNCYGQTELGGEVVGWTAGDLREFGKAKLGAVGRPHPGVSVRVLDSDYRALGVNELGEIYVRSPFATEDDSDRTVDGHLRTGDLGRLDEDGFLWIEGRVSDLINRGGLKVLPQDVESALNSHPSIVDSCVAGVPDERLGEVPVAWVRPMPGRRPDPAKLRSYLHERLAPYQVPIAVHIVKGDFPRNEIGKVLRRELVANYLPERRKV
ncbi:MAG TPA: fatty acid--CoA ligase family protein [Pseudonocardiaceae bacterium]